ncbi:methyl-accepting chemotaxis protein [Vreelandella populi]|uniref:Methyl-accepting chemotaxis protein n=1 Tax=Vreelandella populi TaxID=2498858 RepID=A0A3S0YDP3_9GAMM|nr:methyl-accepting chemotaxis protein [Halomonas populi]RUR35443.1 methyl-accepting chemotaxis protein [Halomonas populi]RUR47632.1 methyl-accepting chemotaxis protein [Halomonas populi]RUR54504.1 methyl-accepting chemotaxis protein [Halomonas populi]
MSKFSRLSLTQKLLSAVALPLLIVAVVLGVIVNQQLNRAIPGLIDNAGTRQVEARADEIGRWINGYRNWNAVLAEDERLAEDLPVATHLDWLAKRYPPGGTIESLFFSNASGDTITHAGVPLDISERSYFKTVVTEGSQDSLLVDPVTSMVSGLPTALVVDTVFDERGNRAGLLGITVSMAAVSDITSAINVGEGSYGWLIDSQGQVIAHPVEEYRMSLNYTNADRTQGYQGLDALSQSILSGTPGSGEITMPSGERTRLMWSPVEGTSWVVGVTVPMTAFTAVTNSLLKSLLLAGGLLLILLLVAVAYATRRSLAPIKHTANAMADIAQGKGDLTRRLEVKSQDEIGDLARGFNAFVERMQATLQEVRHNAQTVLAGASDMADGTHELSSRTEQAAANLQETSASMEEIHSTVAHTSQASEQANGLAIEAAGASKRGTESMTQMESKMGAISESSNKISDIIGLIDSIAFQTNILALNASVEAARAGEQGRGFAVVANEVRTLASRSATAAQDIRALIDVSVNHAKEGNHIVKSAAQQMQEIHRSITQVSDVIGEITAGAREQTAGIEQVNTAVAEMDTMTQQNASMVSQNASLAAKMRENAQQLDQLMSEFVLGDSQPLPLSANTTSLAPSPRLPAASSTPSAPKPRKAVVEHEWEEF